MNGFVFSLLIYFGLGDCSGNYAPAPPCAGQRKAIPHPWVRCYSSVNKSDKPGRKALTRSKVNLVVNRAIH